MKLNDFIPYAMVGIAFLFGAVSCHNGDEPSGDVEPNGSVWKETDNLSFTVMEKDSAKSHFVRILSKAVYDREDVRKFLKQEASRKFDNNTDVLYSEVCNRIINGESFKAILASYSSQEELVSIEKSVPNLNIHVPEMEEWGITVANMDCSDPEIPVALLEDNKIKLYLNGKCEMTIPDGEVPAFHAFVVNENARVTVTRSPQGDYQGYEFHSRTANPAYNTPLTRAGSTTELYSYQQVGGRAADSFTYFYANDNSVNSKALQRDYIYYALTPTKSSGKLLMQVSEYLGYIEVNPRAYFRISDQKSKTLDADPYIFNDTYEKKAAEPSESELIKAMWTEGNYTFRFEIITSGQTTPISAVFDLSPSQLWDFNYDITYVHSTLFRHSKYTYKIDPSKFTAKRVDLSGEGISFGKWDLSEEALYRYVNIYEVDKSETREYTTTSEYSWVKSTKMTSNVKFGLGLADASSDIATDMTSTNSKTEKQTVHITRNEADDNLGTVKIYFYDPIVANKTSNGYELHFYNSGSVKFALIVR